MFADEELMCYTEDGKDKNADWKICLSDTCCSPQCSKVKQRLLQGMHRYFHPDLRKSIDNFHCDACQKCKVDGRGFGQPVM